MATRMVKVFNGFERFWHWTQMVLVFLLVFSGFGIHGYHQLASFDQMVFIHVIAAIGLMVLWVFAIFWHLTTGSWRHYVPTTNGLFKVIRYYAFDIFKGKDHPYRKHYWRKHNPLQALTYLGVKLFLFPAIWFSGLAYLFYGLWSQGPATSQALEVVALIHVAAAFGIVVFIIAHLYLLTTGHSLVDHVKPMITGFDEVELSEAEEAYLKENEPGKIKE